MQLECLLQVLIAAILHLSNARFLTEQYHHTKHNAVPPRARENINHEFTTAPLSTEFSYESKANNHRIIGDGETAYNTLHLPNDGISVTHLQQTHEPHHQYNNDFTTSNINPNIAGLQGNGDFNNWYEPQGPRLSAPTASEFGLADHDHIAPYYGVTETPEESSHVIHMGPTPFGRHGEISPLQNNLQLQAEQQPHTVDHEVVESPYGPVAMPRSEEHIWLAPPGETHDGLNLHSQIGPQYEFGPGTPRVHSGLYNVVHSGHDVGIRPVPPVEESYLDPNEAQPIYSGLEPHIRPHHEYEFHKSPLYEGPHLQPVKLPNEDPSYSVGTHKEIYIWPFGMHNGVRHLTSVEHPVEETHFPDDQTPFNRVYSGVHSLQTNDAPLHISSSGVNRENSVVQGTAKEQVAKSTALNTNIEGARVFGQAKNAALKSRHHQKKLRLHSLSDVIQRIAEKIRESKARLKKLQHS